MQHDKMRIEDVWTGEPYIERVQFAGGFFQNGDEPLHFNDVQFKHVRFNGANLEEVHFTDVLFDTCDFSNAQLKNTHFHRCQFKDVKLTGADFSQALFGHVLFENGEAQYSDFSLSRTNHVAFHQMDLTESNFFDCHFKQTFFVRNLLHRASFIETNLANIDLSTNQYDTIEVTIEKLSNCIVSERQAIGFAKLLGLHITE